MPAPLPPLRLARLVRKDDFDHPAWTAALEAAVAGGLAVLADGADDLVPILTGGEVALAATDGVLDPARPPASPPARASTPPPPPCA